MAEKLPGTSSPLSLLDTQEHEKEMKMDAHACLEKLKPRIFEDFCEPLKRVLESRICICLYILLHFRLPTALTDVASCSESFS